MMVQGGSGKVVLIVDDDRGFRAALAALLRAEGYRAAAVGDGDEAWARLTTGPPPDLVVLDMLLPGIDGWALLARRGADPKLARVPVLVVTALGAASPAWAAELGASGFLRKPVAVEELLAEVRRLCRLDPRPAEALVPAR
jgi:CheY-like chemotaxis protein